VFADSFVTVTGSGVVKLPHSPNHRARVGYPFSFPGASPSKPWLAFLDSLFLDDPDKEEKIALLQEHAERYASATLGASRTVVSQVLRSTVGTSGW